MSTENIFYTSERAEWRQWLAEHFEKETEVWFVFPLKNSGQPGLSYNDAVEEALCFGWIDSIYHAVEGGRASAFQCFCNHWAQYWRDYRIFLGMADAAVDQYGHMHRCFCRLCGNFRKAEIRKEK